MEVEVEEVTLANFNRIYDIIMSYTGFKSLLLRDFGFNLHSLLNLMYYVSAIVSVATFDVWHIITFGETTNFAEAMFQVAIIVHVSSLYVRFSTVFAYRKEIDYLMSFDYRRFNSNLHRPKSSLVALKKSYVLLRRLDSVTKKIYLAFTITWYVTAGIVSRPFIGFITGRNGFEEILWVLPTTLPGEASSIAIHMWRWAFHALFCLVYIYILASTDVFCFSVAILLKKQYQILRNSLFRESGDSYDSVEPLELKLFVQDHVKLIRMTEILRDVMSPIIAGQVSHTIIITACCTYLVATPTANNGAQLSGNLVSYATVSILELFALCNLSHMANTANEELGVGIYGSSWYESSSSKMKGWSLPLLMTQKTIHFKVLGLMDINMETFLRDHLIGRWSLLSTSVSLCCLVWPSMVAFRIFVIIPDHSRQVLQISYSYFTLIQAQI